MRAGRRRLVPSRRWDALRLGGAVVRTRSGALPNWTGGRFEGVSTGVARSREREMGGVEGVVGIGGCFDGVWTGVAVSRTREMEGVGGDVGISSAASDDVGGSLHEGSGGEWLPPAALQSLEFVDETSRAVQGFEAGGVEECAVGERTPSAEWIRSVESDWPTLGEAVPEADRSELGVSLDKVGWECCDVADTSGVSSEAWRGASIWLGRAAGNAIEVLTIKHIS